METKYCYLQKNVYSEPDHLLHSSKPPVLDLLLPDKLALLLPRLTEKEFDLVVLVCSEILEILKMILAQVGSKPLKE